MKNKISIVKCNDYTNDNLKNALRQAVNNSPMPQVKGKSVLLKPNILSDSPSSSCITTNPEFLREVIKLLKEEGAAKIYVGDSPGLAPLGFKPVKCGIYDVIKEENATWVDFVKNQTTHNLNVGKKKIKLPLAKIISEVDLIFSLPKFKTHELMYATGSIKNLFGLVPGLHKSPNHLHFPSRTSFAKLIVEIYKIVKPDYTIMDGIIGMQGPGPANGNPKPLNLIIAGSNLPSVDAAQAIIMGYKPMQIPVLRELQSQKLFNLFESEYPVLDCNNIICKDFEKIQIREKTKFFSSLIIPFLSKGIEEKKQKKEKTPVFNDNCIKCGRCVKICPAKALTMTDHGVKIDSKKCIRCYCCHEVCPANAIDIVGRN